ncbi:hypothetical protein LZ554_008637 [Drepanopeziza brunnea f. sp. 'monogermtubi']|nr:hypothetical protein LZ554_008637 [Drepanopeziza brunnea f. sp. 'monogermtubi']
MCIETWKRWSCGHECQQEILDSYSSLNPNPNPHPNNPPHQHRQTEADAQGQRQPCKKKTHRFTDIPAPCALCSPPAPSPPRPATSAGRRAMAPANRDGDGVFLRTAPRGCYGRVLVAGQRGRVVAVVTVVVGL